MARILDVYFLNNKAGQLTQDDSGRLIFAYETSYWQSAQACPLSISMPLRAEEFNDRITRPFFSGLLPDDLVRKKMAAFLGVSERNPFSLLEIVGGECAGAISLYDEGTPPHIENHDDIQLLDPKHMDELFEQIKRRPLLAGEKDIRLSLAGAQDKITVRVMNDKIALMRGGAPTTHILKTLIVDRDDVQDSVHNELFCLMLASRCGLPAPHAQIRHSTKEPFLLIERYDRKWQNDKVIRLHQEDFCQALSISPENKYEREGGPGITTCLDTIQKNSIEPLFDRASFLNIVIFNYLIGNADAHGKNFSFLYEAGKPQLAPAYDLLSTAVYADLSAKMAMKIGGKANPEDVLLRHWHRLVPEAMTAKKGLEKTLTQMNKVIQQEATLLKAALKKDGIESPIFDSIIKVIKARGDQISANITVR